MDVSAVTRHPALTPLPPAVIAAGTSGQAPGLDKQDQLAVIAARPAALHGASLAAASLRSAQPPVPAGSASGQGSLDTYL